MNHPTQGAISHLHTTQAWCRKESGIQGHRLPQKMKILKKEPWGVKGNIDPDKYALAWMCDHQHGYADEQIRVLALAPSVDGWKWAQNSATGMHQLLSMWHWSSTTHPTTCPPTPTNMEIGWWLPLDQDPRERERWLVDRSICMLFTTHSRGCRLDNHGLRREREWSHKSAPLLVHFWQLLEGTCALVQYTSVGHRNIALSPKEPIDEIHVIVTQWLDETTTQKLSYTAWDIFTYPDSNKSNWKEDCLSYSPGVTGWPECKNARNLAGPTWLCWEVSRYGKSVDIWGAHVGVWPTDKWCRVDPDEGGFLVTYGGGVMIC